MKENTELKHKTEILERNQKENYSIIFGFKQVPDKNLSHSIRQMLNDLLEICSEPRGISNLYFFVTCESESTLHIELSSNKIF